MSAAIELVAELRSKLGRSVSSLRSEGLLPAELYGRGVENIHLTIPKRSFDKVFREAGESAIITLVVGSQKHPVLVVDVQRDFVTNEPIHIDFHKIRMDEKIRMNIPLEFIGEAPAVREQSGVLTKSVSEIEIETLPNNIPHSIPADLSVLAELGTSIYVRDLRVPKDVKVLSDENLVVATVAAPVEEKEEAPVSVADVKVESEEKKAERATEKEGAE